MPKLPSGENPIHPETPTVSDAELLEFLSSIKFFSDNFKAQVSRQLNSEKHGEWIKRQLQRIYWEKNLGQRRELMRVFKDDLNNRREI